MAAGNNYTNYTESQSTGHHSEMVHSCHDTGSIWLYSISKPQFKPTLNEVAKRQERQLGTPVRQYPTVEKTKNMAYMVGLVYWKHNSAYVKGI